MVILLIGAKKWRKKLGTEEEKLSKCIDAELRFQISLRLEVLIKYLQPLFYQFLIYLYFILNGKKKLFKNKMKKLLGSYPV